MLAIILVSVSVGMSNLAGAIAIGLAGVDTRLRLRVALAFGLFEGGMPLVGLLLGRQLASSLGSHANLVGGLLLAATGVYTIVAGLRNPDPGGGHPARQGVGRLVIAGAALSVDNLIVGFALGTYRVSLVVAALTIAAVSVALSLVGLELGSRLGERFEKRSEVMGGAVLIAVGVGIGMGVL